MPRAGEFCPSNVARLVLGVVIVVTLVVAVGVWLFHSPGHATSIEQNPLSKGFYCFRTGIPAADTMPVSRWRPKPGAPRVLKRN